MSSAARLLMCLLLASLALLAAGCATDEEEAPRGPSDNTSALPWNRPMPGDRTGPMGGLPFQSR